MVMVTLPNLTPLTVLISKVHAFGISYIFQPSLWSLDEPSANSSLGEELSEPWIGPQRGFHILLHELSLKSPCIPLCLSFSNKA